MKIYLGKNIRSSQPIEQLISVRQWILIDRSSSIQLTVFDAHTQLACFLFTHQQHWSTEW